MRIRRNTRGGTILPHQRDTDDTTLTVTRDTLRPEHEAAIFATKDQGMSENVRIDHSNRICRVIHWFFQNYPDATESSTRVITMEEKVDPHLYYFAKDEHDFVYSGLDTRYILSFLAELKDKKDGGKFYGVSHMSKFYDAIKWGAGIANQRLSREFYTHMDSFYACYKKEWAEQKKRGNVNEREADTINSALFRLLLQWAIEEGNVFVLTFCLLMWHLIARSINIDSISLHSIKRGKSDSNQDGSDW
jgi:hypothetical protein